MDYNTRVSCTLVSEYRSESTLARHWRARHLRHRLGAGRGAAASSWVSSSSGGSPSQNRREHLEWMGARRAWRGGIHPEREQDLSLGFERSEIEVRTAFFCGDDELGGIPTCWIEWIPCRAASSARRPALCVIRRSQAVGNARTDTWTRAAGERIPRRGAEACSARPRWTGQPGSGTVWSLLDDDRHLEEPPRSRRLRLRDRR
jgi:hypothetical protein